MSDRTFHAEFLISPAVSSTKYTLIKRDLFRTALKARCDRILRKLLPPYNSELCGLRIEGITERGKDCEQYCL